MLKSMYDKISTGGTSFLQTAQDELFGIVDGQILLTFNRIMTLDFIIPNQI